MSFTDTNLSRRTFFTQSAKLATAPLLLGSLFSSLNANTKEGLKVPSWSRSLGTLVNTNAYGLPSIYEKNVVKDILMPKAPTNYTPTSIALTSAVSPLSSLRGAITPNGLFFERHHSGVPQINPTEHKLLIHGLVQSDLVFTMEQLKSFPSTEKTYFIECSGNTGISKSYTKEQKLDDRFGLISCATWVGVKLSTLLKEAGIRLDKAKYIIAEGADGATMARSVPISRAMEDCLIVYAQNGEALRPEQGYPLRLVVPGCEGNINIKWLRRLEVTDTPLFARDEMSKYTDLLSNGKARQGTLVMDVKSVITYPTTVDKLTRKGFYEIRGLAWSGKGKISRVDISLDGGVNWSRAKLSTTPLDRAFVAFTYELEYRGESLMLLSRATDETGETQPYLKQITDVRGFNSESHNNAIQAWSVNTQGEVYNARV